MIIVIRINGGKEKIASYIYSIAIHSSRSISHPHLSNFVQDQRKDLSKKGLILTNFSSIVSGTFLGLGHKAYAEEWLNITVSNGEDER